MLPDYYKVFGLNKHATILEIKKRYRELAKQYHPDINKSPDATVKMQEIQEAYFILSDDEAKVRYDIQYDKVYGNESEDFKHANQNKARYTYNEKKEKPNQEFDDPILEKWIINAKRQAFDFVKNSYRDAKGIAASGCKYYFKALGICILIFIAVLVILSIYRAFRN